MTAITIQTENKADVKLFEQLAKRLNVKITIEKTKSYDSQFVKKIKDADKGTSRILSKQEQAELLG